MKRLSCTFVLGTAILLLGVAGPAQAVPITYTQSGIATGTIGGSLIGLIVGQAFDGTQLPFLVGLALCGATGLALVLWTERGQLFGAIDVQKDRAEVIPPPDLDPSIP